MPIRKRKQPIKMIPIVNKRGTLKGLYLPKPTGKGLMSWLSNCCGKNTKKTGIRPPPTLLSVLPAPAPAPIPYSPPTSARETLNSKFVRLDSEARAIFAEENPDEWMYVNELFNKLSKVEKDKFYVKAAKRLAEKGTTTFNVVEVQGLDTLFNVKIGAGFRRNRKPPTLTTAQSNRRVRQLHQMGYETKEVRRGNLINVFYRKKQPQKL